MCGIQCAQQWLLNVIYGDDHAFDQYWFTQWLRFRQDGTQEIYFRVPSVDINVLVFIFQWFPGFPVRKSCKYSVVFDVMSAPVSPLRL